MESVSPSFLLVLALLGLMIGPTLGSLAESRVRSQTFFDGLSFALVGGLCLLYGLPHVVEHDPVWGIFAVIVGALAPWLAQRVLNRFQALSITLPLTLFSLHAMLDGAALTVTEQGMTAALGWAIVAHRLPVGFAILKAAQSRRQGADGMRLAWFAVGILALATVAGFYGGAGLAAHLPEAAVVGLEGLVIGMLLHIVVVPHGASDVVDAQTKRWSLAGALVGGSAVAWLAFVAAV